MHQKGWDILGNWASGHGSLLGTNQTKRWIRNSKTKEWDSTARISTLDHVSCQLGLLASLPQVSPTSPWKCVRLAWSRWYAPFEDEPIITKRILDPRRWKTSSVGQSAELSILKSSVRFRQKLQKSEKANLHGFELNRPSSKGTKLLFQVIKAIMKKTRWMRKGRVCQYVPLGTMQQGYIFVLWPLHEFFCSFFLGWRIFNLIIVLSGWWTPNGRAAGEATARHEGVILAQRIVYPSNPTFPLLFEIKRLYTSSECLWTRTQKTVPDGCRDQKSLGKHPNMNTKNFSRIETDRW